MSVFRPFKTAAGEEGTVQDQAAAHTGSDEESDNVLIPLCCAVPILSENADIDVISDIERNTVLFFERSADVIVAERKVRSKQDDPLALIDDAWSAGGDRIDLTLLQT